MNNSRKRKLKAERHQVLVLASIVIAVGALYAATFYTIFATTIGFGL
jgi:hypothetical protein